MVINRLERTMPENMKFLVRHLVGVLGLSGAYNFIMSQLRQPEQPQQPQQPGEQPQQPQQPGEQPQQPGEQPQQPGEQPQQPGEPQLQQPGDPQPPEIQDEKKGERKKLKLRDIKRIASKIKEKFDENKTKTETEPESTPSIEVLPSKEFLKFRPEIKTDKEFKEWNYMLDKRYIQAENELQVEFNYQPERDDNNDLMVPSENNFFDKPAENPLYKHNHEQDKQLYDGSGNMTGHYDTFLLRDALDETIHDARIIKNNGLKKINEPDRKYGDPDKDWIPSSVFGEAKLDQNRQENNGLVYNPTDDSFYQKVYSIPVVKFDYKKPFHYPQRQLNQPMRNQHFNISNPTDFSENNIYESVGEWSKKSIYFDDL